MKSRVRSEEHARPLKDTQPDQETEGLDTPPEPDDDELDEDNLGDADDDRWDVFIFDDDGETLPEYGDFWFPD